MMDFKLFSIKSKLIFAVLSILFIALSAYTAFILLANYNQKKQNLINEAKLQSKLIAKYTVLPLIFSDIAGAEEILNELKSVENLNSAVVYDTQGDIFARYINKSDDENYKQKIYDFSDSIEQLENEFVLSTPIKLKDKVYGVLRFHVSTAAIPKEILSQAYMLLFAIIIVLLFSLLMIYRMQKYITEPIIKLASITRTVALSEDYTVRAEKKYSDEVGLLYDDFNYMLVQIEKRGQERDEAEIISQTYQSHLERLTNELENRVKHRTDELQDILSTLQSTQSQLIESEKMSALGNLVAGVAHEVNTPLGIAITAASIFKNEIKTVKELIANEKLSKSALEAFLETINEADDILIKNLDRAALLVRNFKKISVDQSSEAIREFELNDYLLEVISTFKSELNHRPITLKVDLDTKKIPMLSYPGAISQIIINLLQNTLVHGFELEQAGQIDLKTELIDEKVVITFSDNGNGVDESIAAKMFEPFVTTKRNKGGTGLGLNITYNLVTQKLKGTIVLDPKYKNGARFVMVLPLTVQAP